MQKGREDNMSTLPVKELLAIWKLEGIDRDRAVGHFLQHLDALYDNGDRTSTLVRNIESNLKEITSNQQEIKRRLTIIEHKLGIKPPK